MIRSEFVPSQTALEMSSGVPPDWTQSQYLNLMVIKRERNEPYQRRTRSSPQAGQHSPAARGCRRLATVGANHARRAQRPGVLCPASFATGFVGLRRPPWSVRRRDGPRCAGNRGWESTKQFEFMSKRKGRWKAYSNFSLCVAQRRTEFAVSWSTTNSTSVWPVEGFPTWIAKISGSWESDEFGGAEDGCRVNAGKPIAEVGGTALLRSVLATSPDGEGMFG